MNKEANKRYVLITGVSSGLGYALAACFIKEGYFVFGSLRRQEDAEKLRQQWEKNQFLPLIFDVTNEKAIQESTLLVKKQLGKNGHLSILINNAGVVHIAPLEYTQISDFEAVLATNVLGVLSVTQAFLPFLLKPKGKIVNISSVSGRLSTSFLGVYATSKHALESMSHALRQELYPQGIQVLTIDPGGVKSEIWEKAHTIATTDRYENTPYETVFGQAQKFITASESRSLPASEVAFRIFQILQRKQHFRAYYSLLEGRLLRWQVWLIRHLPTLWADAILRQRRK